jgi:hypothetical protein
MDPDRMAEREKKFGKPLLTAAAARNLDPKDPEALRRRAEKFGKKTAPPGSSGGGEEDAARKKVCWGDGDSGGEPCSQSLNEGRKAGRLTHADKCRVCCAVAAGTPGEVCRTEVKRRLLPWASSSAACAGLMRAPLSQGAVAVLEAPAAAKWANRLRLVGVAWQQVCCR